MLPIFDATCCMSFSCGSSSALWNRLCRRCFLPADYCCFIACSFFLFRFDSAAQAHPPTFPLVLLLLLSSSSSSSSSCHLGKRRPLCPSASSPIAKHAPREIPMLLIILPLPPFKFPPPPCTVTSARGGWEGGRRHRRQTLSTGTTCKSIVYLCCAGCRPRDTTVSDDNAV